MYVKGVEKDSKYTIRAHNIFAHNILNIQPIFNLKMKETIHIISLSSQSAKKMGSKIYSLAQCSLTVNECDWHI